MAFKLPKPEERRGANATSWVGNSSPSPAPIDKAPKGAGSGPGHSTCSGDAMADYPHGLAGVAPDQDRHMPATAQQRAFRRYSTPSGGTSAFLRLRCRTSPGSWSARRATAFLLAAGLFGVDNACTSRPAAVPAHQRHAKRGRTHTSVVSRPWVGRSWTRIRRRSCSRSVVTPQSPHRITTRSVRQPSDAPPGPPIQRQHRAGGATPQPACGNRSPLKATETSVPTPG